VEEKEEDQEFHEARKEKIWPSFFSIRGGECYSVAKRDQERGDRKDQRRTLSFRGERNEKKPQGKKGAREEVVRCSELFGEGGGRGGRRNRKKKCMLCVPFDTRGEGPRLLYQMILSQGGRSRTAELENRKEKLIEKKESDSFSEGGKTPVYHNFIKRKKGVVI